MAIQQQCSISKTQWDTQSEYGILTSGNASTMRQLQLARSLNQRVVTIGHAMTLEQVRTEQSDDTIEQIP
eukprot:1554020-Amphidinium_carterae.1